MANQLEKAIANFGPVDINRKIYDRRILIGKIANKPPSDGLFNKVHRHEKFISYDMCQWIINRSEEYASNNDGWTKKRHRNYPTTDLPVRMIPSLHVPLFNLVTMNVFPLIAEHYKLNLYFLNIADLFIVKYTVDGQDHLENHRDGSIISFNILLSDDFDGGGTTIFHTKDCDRTESKLYQSDKGDLLIHPGKLLHGGNRITRGTRYILVGFIEFCYVNEKNRRSSSIDSEEKDDTTVTTSDETHNTTDVAVVSSSSETKGVVTVEKLKVIKKRHLS